MPRLLFSWLLLLLLVACAGPVTPPDGCATAGFAIRDNFPGGQSGDCRVQGNQVRLLIQPEDALPINDSAWYAFAVEPTRTGEAHVVLEYEDGRHRYRPKISTDRAQWSLLPESRVQVTEDRSMATLKIPIQKHQTLYIAGQELITPAVIYQWLDRAATRVGTAVQLLGPSTAGRPIRFVETAPAGAEVLLLVGRQHPPEVTGSLALAPFVDILFGDDALAQEFRQRYSVIVVPLMNPDGVVEGHWRHNLGGRDLNRDWGPFTQPETRLIRDLTDQLVGEGRKVRVFLDFHSTRRSLFYTQSDDDPTNPPEFATRWLDAARPHVVDYPFAQEKRPHDGRPTSKNYMYGRFGIPSITYEMGDEASRAGIRQAAGVFARELMKLMLSVPRSQWDAPYYDVRIDNGLVYDGTTAAPRVTTLALRAGRIVSLDPDRQIPARRVIDATGLAVMPGFIDPHTHALEDLKSPEHRSNRNYLTQGVTTVMVGNDGRGLPDRAEALRVLAIQGTGTHVAFLAGHGTIRQDVMGLAERAPTAAELKAMQVSVAKAMQDGAFGLSTGLYYAPGNYSRIDEVVALAQVAARHGGLYDTHMRSEGAQGPGLLAALEEALEVGRLGRIPVHISHIKALGTDAWGMSADLIRRIDQAREQGLAVTANQYPWRASGTRFSNALIPRSIMADSKEAMHQRLRDPQVRAAIRDEMQANLEVRGGPDAMLVTGADSPYLGMTLSQIAARLRAAPLDAAIEVVLEGDPPIASFVMQSADIHALAVQPWVMTGSDGSRGHPRKYATYPEAYRDLVLENGLMTTAQWVHRSSGLVADTFGLCERGYLRPGYHADIAIIDLEAYRPLANYREATELTPGVKHLLIGGVAAISDGEPNSALPGLVLRKTACLTPGRSASTQ